MSKSIVDAHIQIGRILGRRRSLIGLDVKDTIDDYHSSKAETLRI